MLVEWAIAERPMLGETLSGDRALVRPLPHGILAAVVDGLGHGAKAYQAASRALEYVNDHAAEPIERLMTGCHLALRKTRGAVMSLALVQTQERRLEWLGIGNVEGMVIKQNGVHHHLLLQGGTLGYYLPKFKSRNLVLDPGDLIIMATDGIDRRFMQALPRQIAPQNLANRVLGHFAKPDDDALILVLQVRGGAP